MDILFYGFIFGFPVIGMITVIAITARIILLNEHGLLYSSRRHISEEEIDSVRNYWKFHPASAGAEVYPVQETERTLICVNATAGMRWIMGCLTDLYEHTLTGLLSGGSIGLLILFWSPDNMFHNARLISFVVFCLAFILPRLDIAFFGAPVARDETTGKDREAADDEIEWADVKFIFLGAGLFLMASLLEILFA